MIFRICVRTGKQYYLSFSFSLPLVVITLLFLQIFFFQEASAHISKYFFSIPDQSNQGSNYFTSDFSPAIWEMYFYLHYLEAKKCYWCKFSNQSSLLGVPTQKSASYVNLCKPSYLWLGGMLRKKGVCYKYVQCKNCIAWKMKFWCTTNHF